MDNCITADCNKEDWSCRRKEENSLIERAKADHRRIPVVNMLQEITIFVSSFYKQ